MGKSKTNYFIVVEGVEGAGKSTILRFVDDYLRNKDLEVVVTREPGGTEIAEDIRKLLLNKDFVEKMEPDTELLLMFASRAQHVGALIKPALAKGKTVLSDRFTDASFAYQGGGRGLDKKRIEILENFVQGDLRPDLVLLLDLDVKLGLERVAAARQFDRIEKEKVEFFEKVRAAYLERAHANPKRYAIIDASKTLREVKEEIKQKLDAKIGR